MPASPFRKLWALAVIPACLWAEETAEAEPLVETPVQVDAAEPEATPSEAAELQGYFLSRMASGETLATGVHELSSQEQANLENLIAFEVHSARAGGVNGFAKSFSERRTEAELEATGIHRLSDDQRERLDQHIAGFIAEQPVSYVYRGDRTGQGRGASRSPDGDFQGKGPLLHVNGSVTLEVGTGSGGTYYGGSATTVITDPKGRFQAVISYGTMRGDSPYYYDDYGNRRGPYRPR